MKRETNGRYCKNVLWLSDGEMGKMSEEWNSAGNWSTRWWEDFQAVIFKGKYLTNDLIWHHNVSV